MEIPIRNTIFLQGIFFSQVRTVEESMLEANNIAYDPPSSISYKNNDIRVTKFINKKQWVEAYKDSTLKCWYCGLVFKNTPCFIPRQIRSTPHGKEYDTHGLFCGFACAFSFLKTQAEFVKSKSYSDKLTMMKILFAQIHNKRVVEFKEAPYVYNLTMFGGHVDVVDYRNDLRAINNSIMNEAKPLDTSKLTKHR